MLDFDFEDRKLIGVELTRPILTCALAVHRALGPGLLETAYRNALVREIELQGMSAEQEIAIPFNYRGAVLDCAYRADIIVEHKVLLELKTVERLLPIHQAQVLTYLRLSSIRIGLLMNFNALNLRHGLRRLII
jgi:GxxExxY protein